MIAFVRWIANFGVCRFDGGVGEGAAAGAAKGAGEAAAGTAAADAGATAGVAGGTAASGGGALGAQAAYAAGTEAALGAGAGATLGGGSSSLLTQTGTAVGTAAAGQAVNALLAPRPPKAPGVTETMPDPLAQQRARQQAMAEQLARRGRASTVLTASTDTTQKLGG